ncbi:MAG: hypothetical protein ABI728_12180 [Betaproteobacteria bacterium]
MTEPDKSLDIFGVKPVADAVSHVTKAAVDGASAFLGRICLPAAEEFGLLLRDKISNWRVKNAIAVVADGQARYEKYQAGLDTHAHPRLVASVVTHGSWTDDRTLQQMWGGLLASSCSPDGNDEGNLIFVNLLSQLTALEVRVLNYGCVNIPKSVSPEGLIIPERGLYVDVPTLRTITGTDDIHRLDSKLDHLRSLELIHEGFRPGATHHGIAPSALALNLFVRCQGFTGSAVEFFNAKPPVPGT